MTEDAVERWAERQMDSLDAALLSGRMTESEYKQRVRDLDRAVAAKIRCRA